MGGQPVEIVRDATGATHASHCGHERALCDAKPVEPSKPDLIDCWLCALLVKATLGSERRAASEQRRRADLRTTIREAWALSRELAAAEAEVRLRREPEQRSV